MAITAWSAKVCSELDLAVREGARLDRRTVIAPMGVPSRIIGTATMLRNVATRGDGAKRVVGIGVDVRDLGDGGGEHRPARGRPPVGRHG